MHKEFHISWIVIWIIIYTIFHSNICIHKYHMHRLFSLAWEIEIPFLCQVLCENWTTRLPLMSEFCTTYLLNIFLEWIFLYCAFLHFVANQGSALLHYQILACAFLHCALLKHILFSHMPKMSKKTSLHRIPAAKPRFLNIELIPAS